MSSIEVSANLNTAGLGQYTPFRVDRSGQPVSVSANSGAGGQADLPPQVQGNYGFAQLQLANDSGNQAAAQVRSEDGRLGNIATLLGQMKQQAFQITKMYPPYPPGDSARVKFLRSIDGLRKQIESLIIPPDSKWYGGIAGQATGQVPAASGTQPAVQTFPIPELPDTADNAAVQAAVDSIDKAAEAVATQRAGLAASAGSPAGTSGIDAKFAELAKQAQGDITLAVPSEGEAYQKSTEIKTGLEQLPDTGLTGNQTQVLQALG